MDHSVEKYKQLWQDIENKFIANLRSNRRSKETIHLRTTYIAILLSIIVACVTFFAFDILWLNVAYPILLILVSLISRSYFMIEHFRLVEEKDDKLLEENYSRYFHTFGSVSYYLSIIYLILISLSIINMFGYI